MLCSHLPLVLIDTGGAEIPGVPIRDGDGSRSNDTFTTTADGSTLLRASVSVVDHAEGNNHPADTPTLQSCLLYTSCLKESWQPIAILRLMLIFNMKNVRLWLSLIHI